MIGDGSDSIFLRALRRQALWSFYWTLAKWILWALAIVALAKYVGS